MRSKGNTSSFYEREEVHELSEQLKKQPFNILANKRLKKAKPILTEAKDTINPFRLKQESNCQETPPYYDQADKSQQINLSKVSDLLQAARNTSNVRFSTYQTHFSHSKDRHSNQKLKMNQTISVKAKSRQSMGVSETKKSQTSFDIKQRGEEARRSKAETVKTIQREFNKGKLKEKHLMSWLNQILMEYCFQSQLQKGQLKALQRFGLDQNSLLSRGMTIQDSSRLYKMLFVYSMGFNNLLKELGCTRSTLKSIWKAYAVLLEYCSQGNFQTIMGELERDTMKNQQRLIKEIENRQMQIDNNEQIMEEKLHKYIKQNKELMIQVKALQEKNQLLQKEFREMEMAYNMEVSLRLSYQYKINEIYSVHQKLNILHLNLYKQLQEKTVENKKMAKECWQAKQTAGELKADKEQISGHLIDLKNAITLHQNLIEGLRLNEQQLTQKLFAEASMKREETLELRQKDKRISQLQREVSSSNLMVNIMKSAADSHLEEYRRLMLENSDMRMLNQSQLQKIAELLSDIKYLNSKESTLKSELQYSTNKIKELQERLHAQEAISDDLTRQLQKKQVQLRTKCVEYESQKRLAQSIDRNMKEIKLLYDRLEEENNFNKKYSAEIGKKFEEAHQRVMTLELEVKAIKEQKFQVELDLSRKIGDIITLKKKYEADNQQQNKQYQKLHKVWSGQDSDKAALADQLAAARTQLETANIRISFLSEKFTDMNFQKSKIEAIYKDNLVLHEKEKEAQKTLMIKMSKLTEQIQEAHRQLEVTHKTSQQQLDKLSKQKAQVEKTLRIKEAALKKKEGFVHPMLLEDALQTLKRQIQSHYSTRISLQNQVEKEYEKNNSLALQLQKKEADFRVQIKELQRRAEKMKSEMESEREYFQGKSEQLRALIDSLETQLTFKSMEAERKEDNSSEAKFMELMKSKNTQIQELLGELQRIEDSYQKKCDHYEQEIQHIHHEKEEAMVHLKQSKKQLEVKVIEIEKTYQQKLQQKEREKDQIIQKMLQQRAITEQPQLEEEERNVRPQNKRQEFINRLKFANAYYRK